MCQRYLLLLLGPIAGIIVAFIKNILNFLFNMGDPVGPVANFLAGASFLLSAYYVYIKQTFNTHFNLWSNSWYDCNDYCT